MNQENIFYNKYSRSYSYPTLEQHKKNRTGYYSNNVHLEVDWSHVIAMSANKWNAINIPHFACFSSRATRMTQK